jgi:hydrogenase maturation protein HypF
VGDAAAVRRVATFRPIALAGGDAAIRQPWRIALALLADAFGDGAPVHALPLFDRVAAADVRGVRRMLAVQLNTPAARGVGRYFDGIGALALARPRAQFEGQVAFELNMAADPAERGCYGYDVSRQADLLQVDLRPVVRDVVGDLLDGVAAPIVSARFHNTLIAITAAMVRNMASEIDLGSRPTVVLTGGCFQNARLAEGVSASLAGQYQVFLHRRVPPGDGGIALGQAVVAAAVSRR